MEIFTIKNKNNTLWNMNISDKIVIQNTRRSFHRFISFKMLKKFYKDIQAPKKKEGFSLIIDI